MKYLIYMLIGFVLVNCNSKINQYKTFSNHKQKRDGKWVEKTQTSEGEFIEKGKYKDGEKIGTWKTHFNDKKSGTRLYQKDKIRKNAINTTFYHPNGKIAEKGQSKIDNSESYRRWHYDGDWKTFDDKGKLVFIRHFVDGQKTDTHL